MFQKWEDKITLEQLGKMCNSIQPSPPAFPFLYKMWLLISCHKLDLQEKLQTTVPFILDAHLDWNLSESYLDQICTREPAATSSASLRHAFDQDTLQPNCARQCQATFIRLSINRPHLFVVA
jgi:hypothetical protein